MSTRSKTAVLLASAGVLAAGWQIGTAQGQTTALSTDTATTTTETTTATPTATPTTTATATAPTTTATAEATPTTSASASTSGGATGTFTGATASNRFGTVTVTVTLKAGSITDVSAKATIYEQKSARYVNMALPTLKSEVIAADSADVSNVSGATYTTNSYLTSLQSALDKAGR
ncbi:MAG: FMN-binding protein [Micropruina sp.]